MSRHHRPGLRPRMVLARAMRALREPWAAVFRYGAAGRRRRARRALRRVVSLLEGQRPALAGQRAHLEEMLAALAACDRAVLHGDAAARRAALDQLAVVLDHAHAAAGVQWRPEEGPAAGGDQDGAMSTPLGRRPDTRDSR